MGLKVECIAVYLPVKCSTNVKKYVDVYILEENGYFGYKEIKISIFFFDPGSVILP